MADRAQIEAFKRTMWPHALAVSQQTGVDPKIVLAQSAHETDWGNAAPNNNYFGVKDASGGGASLATTEQVGGKMVPQKARFKVYEDPSQSAADYGTQMNTKFAGVGQAQGLDAQLAALSKSGYATDGNYGKSIGSIARSFADLDHGATPSELPPISPPMPPSQQVSGGLLGQQPQAAPPPVEPQAPDENLGAAVASINALPDDPSAPSWSKALAGLGKSLNSGAKDVSTGMGLLAAGTPSGAAPPMPTMQVHRPDTSQMMGLLNPFAAQIDPAKKKQMMMGLLGQ
ncbi:Mannosyl-glycoprotein endo-beta-N-acetylglucosamidase-like domain containing protein [uncultured Caudovirales phage]|uniref:Mannosyl-glycoprotein endo-beta-N-acetylglucosamidase-like domain containing protein n=1 Tax=uncultured Caudovirales phage TaxID=2100421 RepID=A0A6J5S296_9CAUD|nr:Mannosyl-glycoprotein endo-beta-N-acetylglucosamidase-like domain containing protein [uncultured Caudovirales phage]